MHKRPRMTRRQVFGLTRALCVGIILLGLHFLGRLLAPYASDEAHLALLRLRGTLVLVAVAWYGRYVLLPRARWRSLRWAFLPAAAWLFRVLWPFAGLSSWLALLRGAIVIGVYASLAEQLGAVLRQMCRSDLAGCQARVVAAFTARHTAASLCFLAALTVGVSLYLLAVDYLFDYLIYSLLGVALTAAAYLAPLFILASRLERSLAAELFETAGRMDAALADHSREVLVGEEQVQWILLRSGRLGLTWWHWLHPLGSAALLILAAFLYRW